MKRFILVFWLAIAFLSSFSQEFNHKPDTLLLFTNKNTNTKQKKPSVPIANASINVKNKANDNLEADYPFCGNANDASGNGNHGTARGANLTADRFGNPNSAYRFDGRNDFISVPGINFNFDNNMAISIWLMPSSSAMSAFAGLIDKSHSTDLSLNTRGGWEIERDENSNTFYYAYQCSTDPNTCNNQTQRLSYTPDQWVHFVFSKQGSSVKTYKNGVFQFKDDFYSPHIIYNNQNFPLFIGAERQSSASLNRFFSGMIDDIKIYNRSLSDSEVTALYNLPAPCVSACPNVRAKFSTVSSVCGHTFFTPVDSSIASANDTYYWNFGKDAVPTEYYGRSPTNIFYTSAGYKNIKLRVTNACNKSDSIIHKIYSIPIPAINQQPDIRLCTFTAVNLGNEPISEYTYSWSPGKYLSDSTIANPVLTLAYNGPLIQRVFSEKTNCFAFDTLEVIVSDSSFTANIPAQVVSECKDAVLVAENSLPQNRYIWSTGETSKAITVKNSGLYEVKIFNTCTFYQDTVDVQVVTIEEVLPNIITPNGDGFNDTFKFEGCFAIDTDFTFMVYNRWGSNVYKSDKYQLDWDANGLSDGIYYYALTDNKTGLVVRKSWLQVAR